jgi:hypothetical protein
MSKLRISPVSGPSNPYGYGGGGFDPSQMPQAGDVGGQQDQDEDEDEEGDGE